MIGAPVLGQIDISIEPLIQAGIGVLALIAMIVFGAGAWRIGGALISVIAKLTEAANTAQARATEAQDKAVEAQKAAALAQIALNTTGASLTAAIGANTDEMRKQTAVLTAMSTDIIAHIEASGAVTVAALTERIDTSDADLKAGIARIEAALAVLRDEIRNEIRAGWNGHRTEMLGKLDAIMSELAKLSPVPDPPPLPPHMVRPERKEGAA
jgi:hypothetical protein